MARTSLKILLTAAGLFLCCFCYAQTPATDKSWQPYFVEDFNGPINWDVWQAPSGQWQPTREKWEKKNVKTKDGICYLKAKGIDSPWHLGGLETKNMRMPYGYYEIRWQLPDPTDRWIAFWACCGESAPPVVKGDELDFVENFAVTNKNELWSNWWTTLCKPEQSTSQFFVKDDLTKTMNTVGLEWTPKTLLLYYNDRLIREIFHNDCVPFDTLWKLYVTPGVAEAPHYPDLSRPQYTLIDWIKVWTLKKDLTDVKITNSTDLDNFHFGLKRSVTLHGDSPITIREGRQTLRATDHIEISGDFTLYPGAELTLFTHGEPDN